MLAFGIRRFSPARFGKEILAAANSSKPDVRNEAMNCYKAIFQWIGDGETGVDPFIEPLKEAQKVQLRKDFEAIKAEKKEFKRKTRTEAEAAKQAGIDALIEEEKKDEPIDIYDMQAPQDILGQFGAAWIERVSGLSKWAEKSEAMQEVTRAADVPKLAPGNYSGLFEVLKKFAGDAHASVSQNSIRAISALAKGLRDHFHDQAVAAVPVLFTKFKEKRLTEDILKALEHIMGCIKLGEIIENLSAVKTEKAPISKINIAEFVNRAIRTTMIDDLEELVDRLAPIAVGISDEKDATLREKGLIILGVLLARVPSTTQKYVDPLIDAKKKKINEAKDTVQVTKYDKSERKAAAAAAAAKKKAAAAAKAKPKPAAAA